jgi:hypothetical protein
MMELRRDAAARVMRGGHHRQPVGQRSWPMERQHAGKRRRAEAVDCHRPGEARGDGPQRRAPEANLHVARQGVAERIDFDGRALAARMSRVCS